MERDGDSPQALNRPPRAPRVRARNERTPEEGSDESGHRRRVADKRRQQEQTNENEQKRHFDQFRGGHQTMEKPERDKKKWKRFGNEIEWRLLRFTSLSALHVGTKLPPLGRLSQSYSQY